MADAGAPPGAPQRAVATGTAPVTVPELRLGAVRVHPGVVLAPMEGVTDLPFRVICKRLGAAIVYTEFINAEGLVRGGAAGRPRTLRKVSFVPEERPLGIQLYGADPESMARAAETAAAQAPDLLDVNCGCWVRNIALRGAGAGLLRDPDAMRAVVSRVVRATDLPVTVKTRLGWDAASIRIIEVAQMLADVGVQGLTVHCRTRAQGHSGDPDYTWIERLRAAVDMPVILNGGVTCAADVAAAFAQTGCSGVMVGRGAIRHPWIFREARALLLHGHCPPPPTLAERVDLCLEHLRLAVEHAGDRYALVSLRRHYSGYFRGLRGAAALRQELAQHQHLGALVEHLHRIRAAGASQQESIENSY